MRQNHATSAELPLNGVRVVDLTRVLAGPLCTMMLGDLGADVIKVERPRHGDETRGWGPPYTPDGQSAYFLAINRNKLSVALDLADANDRSTLATLIAGADVVVDNFLPGALARQGIDPDAMLAKHDSLVWCTIAGFRDSDRPGYDFVVQAESGMMAITGEPDGAPMKVGVAVVDVLAGKDAAIAILAALHARRQRGAQARRLRIHLMDSARAALVNVAQNVLVTGADARRWGNAHPNLVPYQLFHASDKPIVIAVGNDAQWQGCVRALEIRDFAADETLATNSGRVARREEVTTAMAKIIAARTAGEWMERLGAVGVPCGMVKGVLEGLDGPDSTLAAFGLPSSVGGTPRIAPPALGEHTDVVRAEGWAAFGRYA